MKLFGFGFDLLLAGILALGCGALTTKAFLDIQELEKPTFTLLGTLVDGDNHFSLSYQEQCVGSAVATVSFEEENSAHNVKGGVSLDVLVRGTIVTPNITYELYFNPLGQLTIGQIRLHVGENLFTILLTEANPIKVSAWSGMSATAQKFSLEVPGPLLLTRHRRTFTVGYPIRGGRLPSFMQAFTPQAQSLSSTIPVPQVTAGDECRLKPRHPLDLSALTAKIDAILPSLPSQIPLHSEELSP